MQRQKLDSTEILQIWRLGGPIGRGGGAMTSTSKPILLPRLIRFRDAPGYLGMDRNRFNAEVRPALTAVKIGKQGVAFDRLELDAWADQYLARNGRPAQKGALKWDESEIPASSSGVGSGMSTNASAGGEFAKALKHVILKKRNVTSQG